VNSTHIRGRLVVSIAVLTLLNKTHQPYSSSYRTPSYCMSMLRGLILCLIAQEAITLVFVKILKSLEAFVNSSAHILSYLKVP
jgi:hypothetical protein